MNIHFFVRKSQVGRESYKDIMLETVTVPGNTILELVEFWGSTSDNDTTAFVSIDASGSKRTLSRKEILELSKRFAHRLHNLGIKKGDIVCNALPNSLERVISEFGIQFSGAASMNGQLMRSDGEDFLESLRISKCVAVILDPKVPKSVYNILIKIVPPGCENSIQSDQLPNLKRLILCVRDEIDHHNDFLSSLRDSKLPEFSADVYPEDLATVMTTSGSTGYSKLVKHSHANICHFGKQVKCIEPLPGGAHFVNCAPLGWAGGYPQWYLSCGVTRHFIDMHAGPPSDVPGLLWKIIVQERIVYGFLTPMFANAIMTNSPWQTTEWKPKILCLAGQPVKKEILTIIGKLCDAVDVNYGMTECNLLTTHRIVDPSNYTDGCGGYPGYGVKIKIVDTNGQDVPQGSIGEILINSPSLCSGYLSNESARPAAFTQDGWFCTDDAGYMGLDGKIYVEGRQSDSILRGVYILYPAWLEKKMVEFPGVREIAIVAVPDKVLHNEICACVAVSNVEGVVPGCLHNIDNDKSPPLDSHKSEDFMKNCAHKPNNICCGLSEREYEPTNEESQFANKECCISCKPEPMSKQVMKKDTNKPNSSKHSQANTGKPVYEDDPNKKQSSSQKSETNISKPDLDLQLLEKDLRSFANDLNILFENDAMRMVPKYYVFMKSLPTTTTGKMNRKEVRNIAAQALGLV